MPALDAPILLLVDDDPTCLQVLAELLSEDYRLTTAVRGEEALALASSQPQPDLILLDVMMPGMDGLEVLRRLRGNPQTNEIAVIFVSADSSEQYQTSGLEGGADDYLVKPIQPLVLRAKIANLLRREQAEGKLKQLNQELTISYREERQRAEAMLKLTRFSVDAASDGIFWTTPDGHFVDVNAAACRSLGYTREELLQLSVLDIDVHYTATAWRQHFAELRQKGSVTLESIQRAKDGRMFPVEVAANYVEYGSEILNIAIIRDISERKKVEADLLATKLRLKATLDAIPDLLFETDRGGRIFDYHTHRADLLAAPPEAFMGKCFSEVLPPEVTSVCLSSLQEASENGWSIGKQYELHLPQGDRWFELSVTTKPGVDGESQRFIVVSRDVTDRKIASLELEKFKAIILSTDDAIIGKTLTGVITSWNPGAEHTFGYSADEAIGHPLLMLIPVDRQHEEPEILARIAQGDRIVHFETKRLHKNGRLIDISTTISPILDDRGKVIGVSKIARDITDRKKTEAELEEKRARLASFAIAQDRAIEAERKRLAREVHDQIGQVFTAIKLIINSIPEPMIPPHQETALAQALEMGIATTRKITAQLKPPLLDDLGLGAALGHLGKECAKLGNLSVDVRVADEASLDATQALTLYRIVQEATTNILRHASAKHVIVAGCLADKGYELRIRDDGQGFVLTDVRPGGMGLENMRERAMMLGGTCEISTEPRAGTRVTVTLPLNGNGTHEHSAA